jgi:arylformamidase
MRIEDYPQQEPFSDFGRTYRDECLRLSAGIEGEEHAYGSEHPSQGIMVFPAERPNGIVLIFLHGGGWTNGYKEEMSFLAPRFLEQEISFVTIGYRLAPRYVFPANLDDAADAVAKVLSLADRYKYDRERVFIGGHSAGGHLSSLLALRNDWQAPRNLPADVLKGCLPISGSYDFTPGAGFAMRPRFLGAETSLNEVHASPVFAIQTVSVPFLVAHGSRDFPHLITQAHKFRMVLDAKGADVQAVELPDDDHLTVVTSAARQDSIWIKVAAAWMKRVARL